LADVSGNVEAISNYTISATGTITYATWVIFAAMASEQVTADDPGFTAAQSNYAQALYVCHLIAVKLGKAGKTSESLGKGSYSKQLASGQTSWLDQYQAFVQSIGAGGISLMSTDGLTRDDATMPGLGLDQSTVYDLNDEERDE
jgi:hypothetical protein